MMESTGRPALVHELRLPSPQRRERPDDAAQAYPGGYACPLRSRYQAPIATST